VQKDAKYLRAGAAVVTFHFLYIRRNWHRICYNGRDMIAGLIKSAVKLARQTWDNRRITWEFALRTLQKKYKGSALGIVWAGVRPLAYVLVFWFVFEMGIRGGRATPGNVPFIVWLIPGMFAWQYISSVFSEGANSIRKNRALVTKTVFPAITIPQFTVLSLFLVHVLLMICVMIGFALFGFTPTVYWLQMPYFFLASFVFTLLISTFFSVLTVYSKDITHLLRSATQLIFWLSAIIWPFSTFEPGTMKRIMMLNPVLYIVEGYRNILIYDTWFWANPLWVAYFWGLMAVMGLATLFVWTRMSKNFADVL